jgi:GH18 family chitinase
MNNEPVDYPLLQAGGIIENNKPYGWHCFIGKGKEEQDFLFINGKSAAKPDASWDKVIPLYTQQRPHNTVLVPCDKLAEMQAEIEALKTENSHLKYEISSGAWNPAELTDEEKWEVFTNLARSPDLRADMIRFADSILRKAQK